MKLAEAKKIIYEGGLQPRGYRVCFERVDGRLLCTDYFPERNEYLIDYEEEAWELARQFANATRNRCVNIHVVDDQYRPVPGYEKRRIINRSRR
jgi:hypothetical protein